MQAEPFRPESSGIMQFTALASSRDRMWRGFEAFVYDISAGVAARPPSTDYVMSLHLSSAVEGACRCDGAFVRRIIKPGDIDFIPLGYAATWFDTGPGRVASIRLGAELVHEAALAMGQRDATSISFPARLSLNDPVLRHLLLAVVAELEGGDDGPLFAESIGLSIAMHLLRQYAEIKPRSRPRGFSRRQLARVVEYIDANLATSLSYSAIASVAGVSPSHLKALFKRSLGMPVHQYVIRRRVDCAVRLLSESGARLCDVAQQAGFSDQSHMARCMRRSIGMTPATILRA